MLFPHRPLFFRKPPISLLYLITLHYYIISLAHPVSRKSFFSIDEIIKMPPSGRSAHSYPDPQCSDNVMSERVTRLTPRSDMDSQSLPTPITKPFSEELPNNNVASINRCTRGPT
ncbi:uncharacterized protein LOC130794028 isoform X2 [Actinidia eriantha]|uniref:uncharacterized protein LOC130794028 isoform X2 n=1 Tax=Actinidia eriantha TaxID=165200 RepID=UPI0025887480|nr:uncharacterized protein LOC130794028 isoform X2 [Actinidia eriantha]